LRSRRAVAVGVFDGVHLGHRALLRALRGEAQRRGLLATALAFSNHPQEILSGSPPPRLTTNEERRRLIEEEGLEVFEIPFTPELASMEAAEFSRRILKDLLGAELLVLGEGARMGRGQKAGPEELREALKPLGIEVVACPTVKADGKPISSSRIRALLLEGEAEKAASLLGRPYELTGVVVRGEGRGRRELVPTCNIRLPQEKLLPKEGVYAARAEVKGEEWPAVVNIGRRPTFGGGRTTVEAHLIGAPDLSLYGERMTLRLMRRLREERKFSSPAELRFQIKRDIEEALRVLGPKRAV